MRIFMKAKKAAPAPAPEGDDARDVLYRKLAHVEALGRRAHAASQSIYDASLHMEAEIARRLAHEDLDPDERRELLREVTILRGVQGLHREGRRR